ncbi:MAG: type II secretion system protein [Phycisphaerae bacterium]|nr:type II secretion system protein [Phycisphaerae bacterium]
MTNRTRGFSLLEVILVLAITLTFASIALPLYSRAVFRHQANLAARRVAADLRQAQSCARTASASRTVTFWTATETYEISGVASFDGAPGNYVVDLRDEPYEAQLVSADFGGSGQILFDGWGTPSSGGSVLVAVGAEQRTIVVDGETGQVTIP